MTDIVERLRWPLPGPRILMREAADEIERLRVVVKTAAGNFDSLGAQHFASWCRLSLEPHPRPGTIMDIDSDVAD